MVEGELIIRPMKKQDLREIAVLYTDIYSRVDIGKKWTKESAYSLMKHLFSKQTDLCFVALIEDTIVGGFVAGIKPWWDGNYLTDGEIFVDNRYHKHRIGSKLSKILYKTALDKYNIVRIDFITFSKNGFPLSWYTKLGFETEKQFIMINGAPKKVLKRLKE